MPYLSSSDETTGIKKSDRLRKTVNSHLSKKQIVIIIAFLVVFFILSFQNCKFQLEMYQFKSEMYQFQMEVSEQQLKMSQTDNKLLEYLLQLGNFLQRFLEENTNDLWNGCVGRR